MNGHENAADAPGFAVARYASLAIMRPQVSANPALSLVLSVILSIFVSLLRFEFHNFHVLSATTRAPASSELKLIL